MLTLIKLGNSSCKQNGFTLIEILIYIALFSIIIGGVLASAYQIIQASSQSQDSTLVSEEANFLEAKINWALTGATAINLPASGVPGIVLDINKSDGTNPFFSASTNQLFLNGKVLNSDSVKVENVSFTHLTPEGIQAVFRVTSKLTGFTQNATTTKYLRK